MANASVSTPAPKVQSISRRFSYTFVGVVTILLLGYAAVAIFVNITRIEAGLENTVENALKLSNISLPAPLWKLDNDIVHDFIEALFWDQSLVYAEVSWGGQVIAKRLRPKFQHKDFAYFERSMQFIVRTSDILYEGSKVGTLHLAVSRESVKKELLINIASIMALTLLLIVAISLTSMVITNRYISRPLSTLQHSATLIAQGDLEAAIDTRSRDEIGRLAQDLNVMRGSIKQLFGALHDSNVQLEEYSRTLEQKVTERTHELTAKNEELEQTLTKLEETQDQLVVQEKLASLGALTAGIAHEIKNPLNFVINFAQLAGELSDDLTAEIAELSTQLPADKQAYVAELLADLKQNVTKINEHGRRADSIVHGMLQHSREQSGVSEPTDLNGLLDEYLHHAYHGLRAQDAGFNVRLETDYDPKVGRVALVAQDISRVFLNIINNACYAADAKRQTVGDGFIPTVRVSSRDGGDHVEIRIHDNGTGIPPAARDKIFNPFFTTKPAGNGTGLGLSISFDIVVRQHHGELRVESEEGRFTEFIIVLPKRAAERNDAHVGQDSRRR